MEANLIASKDFCGVKGEQGALADSPSSNVIDLMLIVSPSNAISIYIPFYYLYLAGYMEKFGIRVTIVDPLSVYLFTQYTY